MGVFKKYLELKEYGYASGFLKGMCGYVRLWVICKVRKLDMWHVYPLQLRPYALWIVDYVNNAEEILSVAEVGCGLGEIIGNLSAPRRDGYDLDENVICAAQRIHKKCAPNFHKGSFSDIRNKEYDCLIAVNFTHGIDTTECSELFNQFTLSNRVKYIIVDEVKYDGYEHYHRFSQILHGYDEIVQSPRFKSNRVVKVFKRAG